jgi:hypothetical protein
MLGVGCFGCDQGHQDDQPVINSSAPITPALLTATVQAGDAIVLQFNRYLNPGSVNRQTIQLLTSSGNSFTDPLIAYDPVLLQVTLSNPGGGQAWLTAGQNYNVKIIVATPTTQGLLAIDNATLGAPFEQSVTVNGPETTPAPLPAMHFCVDVLPIFINKCAYTPACHASPSSSSGKNPLFADGGTFPAAGLVLDSAQGIIDTAIGKVAHGSNVGPMAGTPSSPSCPTSNYSKCPFAVDMPIIDPGTNGSGDPANSWLLYKTLLATPPATDDKLLAQCAPAQTYETSSNPTPSISSSDWMAARAALDDFILGSQMPYPVVQEGGAPLVTPLSVQELERIRLWIQEGAKFEIVQALGSDGGTYDGGLNCSLCQQIVGDGGGPPPLDGGSDAPSDAGGG